MDDYCIILPDIISIHALREEGDLSIQNQDCQKGVFLSTPSARRATLRAGITARPKVYFYPRPPRGGRPMDDYCIILPDIISIHALREEGDPAAIERML